MVEAKGEQGDDVPRRPRDSRLGVCLFSLYQDGGFSFQVVNEASSFDELFQTHGGPSGSGRKRWIRAAVTKAAVGKNFV